VLKTSTFSGYVKELILVDKGSCESAISDAPGSFFGERVTLDRFFLILFDLPLSSSSAGSLIDSCRLARSFAF